MKNKKILKKQRIRFTLLNLIIYAIIFTTIGLTATSTSERFFYRDANRELSQMQQRLANEGLNGQQPDRNPPENEAPLPEGNPRIAYFIYDNNKALILSLSNIPHGLDYRDLPEPEDNEKLFNVRLDRYNYRVLSYSLDANEVIYYAQLLINIDGEISMRNNISRVYFICLLLIIFLSIAASYIMSFVTMRPVEKSISTQNRFVSDASHELRTPLTVLHGKLEQLLSSPDAKILDKSEDISSCLAEVIRLSNLSKDLLQLAKSDSEKIIVDKTAFDITALIKRIAAPYMEIAEFDNKQFFIKGESLVIKANQERIIQAMIVLFDNALKYTKASDKINIEISGNRSKCQIIIADTGIGVSEDGISKIFDRFYRDDASRTISEGSGLGLAICKQIIQDHNGSIYAYHNIPRGLKFIIILPTN